MTTMHAAWAVEKTTVRHALIEAGYTVNVVEDGLNRVVLLASYGELRHVIVGRPPNAKRPVSAFWLFKQVGPAATADEFKEALKIERTEGGRTP